MTINKIALSALAASVLGTIAMAGTITNTDTIGLIGQEKLSLSDVNVSKAFRGVYKVVYTPTDIPATSLKNPIFKYTFGGGTALNVDTNTSVWEGPVDGNETNTSIANWRRVAGDMQVSGTNSEVASFNAIDSTIYVYNNKKYIVADDNGTILIDANVTKVTVAQGSTANLTLQAELYSGDSQAQADLAPATTIATVGKEFTGSITQKFDARIDASSSFKLFYDQNSDGATKLADNAIFNIHKNATLSGASLGVPTVNLNVFFDQNTSAYMSTGVFSGTGVGAGTLTDLNDTTTITGFNTTTTAHDANATLTLTNNGTAEIKKTVFDAHAYVTSGTTNFDIITKSTGNAGKWTIYGYNAQIPDVMPTSNYVTYMKFTNRSSLDTGIYFTLIDQDGTVVQLNSVDDGLANLPANTTKKYKASDLATLAVAKDANFDASKSISIEVSIPTTPTDVYGMASLKNVALGQFKDLPIYNNGNSY
ncbi:hypothetical protein LCX93_01385 [Sulfurimonas sp. SWIR-19]|uniref:hypothetical protein n=1 Tax=Sulfurimonas sp. SWIR-19 TaxID=2878390 RepID=UPI001CF5C162|nr:hypothetical protein [Sulfurimonas sp. SWIR-19]UCN00596.1 hypothetical protein LCX93_01385 [Sulfurimonas sp. SWIR-19]